VVILRPAGRRDSDGAREASFIAYEQSTALPGVTPQAKTSAAVPTTQATDREVCFFFGTLFDAGDADIFLTHPAPYRLTGPSE
jgi:hypothetical protein